MFEKYYPWRKSISSYDIDYEGLYMDGVRGLIYDIDNTLVEHGADANERAIELFGKLFDMGFSVCFISNNNEERVKRFYDGLKAGGVDTSRTHYVFKANKPMIKHYISATKLMNLEKDKVVFVGDQLFTDVYGANRAGIKSILVKPIDPKEEIQIVFKRKLENVVMKHYDKSVKKFLESENLVLIGFMGSGKTSVGKALAKKLNMECIDTDKFIEENAGMTINEIFAEKGEDYFRSLETAVLSELSKNCFGKIICCGGGTPLREENVEVLHTMGTIVYLKVSPETVIERLKDDDTRPLLKRPDKEAAVKELLDSRKAKYYKAADMNIVTDGKTAEAIADEIIANL